MASKTMTILQNLKTQLSKIKEIDGYNTTVEHITFRALTPQELVNDITISIVPGNSPILMAMNNCWTVGDDSIDLDGWVIGLVLIMKFDIDTAKSGEHTLLRENLIADVINCIANNNNLSLDYVKNVVPVDVERYPEIGENILTALIPISVKYDWLSENM